LPGSKGTILVIDDDIAIREALRDTLEDQGYRVAEAGNGVDALTYLRTHPAPALIFLDWNMAPMDAPEFMKELNKEPSFAGVPVVLVTADARAEDKAKTDRYDGYLTKPVDLDTLFSVAARFAS